MLDTKNNAAAGVKTQHARASSKLISRKQHQRLPIRTLVIILALGLFCAIQLLPFWIAVTTSVKAPTDHSPQMLFPSQVDFKNFGIAISKGGIFTAILNSVIVTASAAALASILSALAAYPLARRSTGWNRTVYAAVVSLIMVPPLSILVPLYSFLVQIGATNTLWGEILVMTTMQVPLAVFLYAAFIRSVPIALDEAAALDGAGPARTFFMIIFPILKPVTATVLILSGVAVWNEFALSSYLLTETKVRTIAPAVASFFAAQGSNIGAAAAASLLAAVPVVVAYLFLQRYFIRGMLAGAEK